MKSIHIYKYSDVHLVQFIIVTIVIITIQGRRMVVSSNSLVVNWNIAENHHESVFCWLCLVLTGTSIQKGQLTHATCEGKETNLGD